MAEETHKNGTVSWITFADGTSADVTKDDVMSYAKQATEHMKGKALRVTRVGDNIRRIDIDIEAMEADGGFSFDNILENGIPISETQDGTQYMRVDVPYFALFEDGREGANDADLLACTPNAIAQGPDGPWKAKKILLLSNESGETAKASDVIENDMAEDGTITETTFGDVGMDPENLFCFELNGTGERLSLRRLFSGVFILETSMRLAMDIRDRRNHGAITFRDNEVVAQMMRATPGRKRVKSITLKNNKGEIVTKISAIEDFLTLKASNKKTFVLLNNEATMMSLSGNYRHDGDTVCRVILSIKKVAERYGITEESARKRLRRDFQAIANESLTAKSGKDWVNVPVLGDTYGFRGDSAMFSFSPSFMNLILNPKSPRIDLPPEAFTTDDQKYPPAFQIVYKLYKHDNLNYGRPHQDRMKLTTLLNAATEIPRAESLKGRSKTKRIMGPFEASMNHLQEIGALKYWGYCHENGEPLTDREQQIIETEKELGKPTPWELAEGLLVTWDLGERYPKLEEARRESREKRREAATVAKAKKDKEAEARERRIRGKVETLEAKKRFEESRKNADDSHAHTS